MADAELERLTNVILRFFPELRTASFTLETQGWDSIAVDADDRLIFKFPRGKDGEHGLRLEAALLAIVGPSLSLRVPTLRLVEGPPLFSVHEKIRGEHLLSSDYAALPEQKRRSLGEKLGQFYAELHGVDQSGIRATGVGAIEPWRSAKDVRDKALPRLQLALRTDAEKVVAAFEQLPDDPHGSGYGFFDGHGWNMAFDHDAGELNGLYDFGDSGFGPLHQEFVYSNFISTDLTERIIAVYERLTGRAIGRERVDLLTGYFRLSEIGELAGDPAFDEMAFQNFLTWRQASVPGSSRSFLG
jgi:aminoglycoside phosphotransferase (APT) family kinase protein